MTQSPSPPPSVRLAHLARLLYDALGIPLMECRKLLWQSGQDLEAAAQLYATGAWRRTKLVSFGAYPDQEVLQQLGAEFGMSAQAFLEVLLDCGGNKELALRKLRNQPLYQPENPLR